MSIYASFERIGESEDRPDGTVLEYRGSHRFPSMSTEPAAIDLSVIPGHCVPGHAEDVTDDVSAYLRLDVRERASAGVDATVVLTEEAVKKIHAQLGRWVTMQKTREGER